MRKVISIIAVMLLLVAFTGCKGSNGDKGATGATGLTGTTGQAGSAGTNGTNGIPGVPGPIGPQGPAGAGVDFIGEVSALITVPTSSLISLGTTTIPSVYSTGINFSINYLDPFQIPSSVGLALADSTGIAVTAGGIPNPAAIPTTGLSPTGTSIAGSIMYGPLAYSGCQAYTVLGSLQNPDTGISNWVETSMILAMLPPDGLVSSVTGSDLNVSGNAVAGATSYNLFDSATSGVYSAATMTAIDPVFTIVSASTGTHFNVITATGPCGNSINSAEVSVVVP